MDGIGASAHSYDGAFRQWNVADIREYIRQADSGRFSPERERIDPDMRYNDTIITALRTSEGLDIAQLGCRFGEERKNYCLLQAQPFIAAGTLILEGEILRLSRTGIFVSDTIMSSLLFVGDD